jgi:hypothetical protein
MDQIGSRPKWLQIYKSLMKPLQLWLKDAQNLAQIFQKTKYNN